MRKLFEVWGEASELADCPGTFEIRAEGAYADRALYCGRGRAALRTAAGLMIVELLVEFPVEAEDPMTADDFCPPPEE